MATENNILVIDDEVQIRRLLEITLNLNGYKVSEAATAKEGIVAAATHNPALVILDLGLPDEDGLSVLRKLREWYQNPIIILSVRNSEEDIIKALDIGANDYLTKPFRKSINSSVSVKRNMGTQLLRSDTIFEGVCSPVKKEN